jgi:DNA-binding transcriptional LysR family regulator
MTDISNVDLNLLRVLDALLIDVSTKKAAVRLNLSQPAVSAALSRLRITFDDPLFLRQGQGLAPTDRALALEYPLKQVLHNIEDLLGQVEFDPAESTEHFRISGSDFYSEMLMPALGNHLADTAPNIVVHLVDLLPGSHATQFEQSPVDISLFPKSPMPNWLDWRPVFNATFFLMARRGNRVIEEAKLKPGDTIPLDLFCDLHHILYSIDGKPEAMADRALAELNRKRRVVMTVPSFSGVIRCVSVSDRVAFVPSLMASTANKLHGLEIYKSPIDMPKIENIMAWHKKATDTPSHKWLREQLVQVLSTF